MRGAVTVGLFGVLLVGCAPVRWATTYSSVPTLLPSETWSQMEDGMFATAGMKVRVEAYNHRGGREWSAGLVILVPIVVFPTGPSWKQERPFRIHVTFDATGRDFAFDPRRVTLASETIRPMAPTEPDTGAPRLVPELSAFDLTFDIEPPDPEREFTLLLDGLARGDMPVPPLRIRFKPVQHTIKY